MAALGQSFESIKGTLGSINNLITYIPGDAFFGPENSMRLNFSARGEETISAGMKLLGSKLKEYQSIIV